MNVRRVQWTEKDGFHTDFQSCLCSGSDPSAGPRIDDRLLASASRFLSRRQSLERRTVPRGASFEMTDRGASAHRTWKFGMTFRMLERLSRVFGAFQQQDGSFEVWALPASAFGQSMRDSQSGRQRGATPKVGLVRRSMFMDSGT